MQAATILIDTVQKILTNIKTHFRNDPFFLWCVFIFMAINPVLFSFINSAWIDVLLALAITYIIACTLTLLLSYCRGIGYVLKVLCLLLVFIYTSLALFCLSEFGMALDPAIFETLLNTNPEEVKEFFHVFIPWWLPFLCLLVLVSIFCAHYLCLHRYKLQMGTKHLSAHAYLFTYIIIVMAFCPDRVTSRIQHADTWTIPFENIAINLKQYEPESIALTETDTLHPQKIVLIIGESHSKGHSSIYGYEKPTNPLLSQMVADSTLLVFNHAIAPATATVQSFKYILNTRRTIDYEKEWYLYPSIITILKSVGYDTSWYSNQDEVGLHDNLASCYAHICHHYQFNTSRERLDGDLLGMHTPSDSMELVIYHLMGQHVDFSKRYPATFCKFKAVDYDQKKYEKRDIAAHYDNACLYNDYVIASIMHQYQDEDAIVIYFPDHGIDVFESSPRYFGHAHGLRKVSRECGENIPLYIYTTRRFTTLHPAVVQSLLASVNQPFCTADMPYMLMEIAGYKMP